MVLTTRDYTNVYAMVSQEHSSWVPCFIVGVVFSVLIQVASCVTGNYTSIWKWSSICLCANNRDDIYGSGKVLLTSWWMSHSFSMEFFAGIHYQKFTFA
jgi:hypothetical protein